MVLSIFITYTCQSLIPGAKTAQCKNGRCQNSSAPKSTRHANCNSVVTSTFSKAIAKAQLPLNWKSREKRFCWGWRFPYLPPFSVMAIDQVKTNQNFAIVGNDCYGFLRRQKSQPKLPQSLDFMQSWTVILIRQQWQLNQ